MEHTANFERGRMRQLAAAGAVLLSLGTTACLPEHVQAATEFCSASPDVVACLGQIANMGSANFASGGQIVDKAGVMYAADIDPSDFASVDSIVTPESGWCYTKWQGQRVCPPTYKVISPGADGKQIGEGLCQSTPANKMAAAGPDWRTNAVTQLKWCAAYAKAKYHGWKNAAAHWRRSHNW